MAYKMTEEDYEKYESSIPPSRAHERIKYKKTSEKKTGNGNGNGNGNGPKNPNTVSQLGQVRAIVRDLANQRIESMRGFNPAAAVEDVRPGKESVASGGDEIPSYNPKQTTRLRKDEDEYA